VVAPLFVSKINGRSGEVLTLNLTAIATLVKVVAKGKFAQEHCSPQTMEIYALLAVLPCFWMFQLG